MAVPPPPASRREEGPARGGCTPGSARGNGCTRSSLSRLRVRIQILEMEMIRSEYPVPLRKFIETPAEITCGNCMGKVKKKTTRLERTYKDCHSTCQMLRAVAQVYWAGSNPASERSGAGRECCTGEAVRVLGVHVGTLSMSLHRVGGSRAGQDQTNEWPASTARELPSRVCQYTSSSICPLPDLLSSDWTRWTVTTAKAAQRGTASVP